MFFFLVSLFVCTFLHRFFILFFDLIPIDKSYLRAYFSGFFSDLSFLFLFSSLVFFVWLFLKKSKKTKIFYEKFFFFISSFNFLIHLVHLRYIEHFGMMLKPFHLFSINTMPWQTTGLLMVLESKICLLYLSFSFIVSLAIFYPLHKRKVFLFLEKKPFSTLGFMCLFFLVSNASWIQMRKNLSKNHEIKSSLIASFYYSLYKNFTFPDLYSPETLKKKSLKTRKLLGEGRSYISDEYPLWQKEIASYQLREKDKNLFQNLSSFLRKEEKKNGPWNIILLISESLRAFELESFGLNGSSYKGLTPNITSLAKTSGIKFTEIFAPARGTRKGQPAIFCSLYTFFSESVMNLNPTANLKCLGSILKEKGYHTSFFYPSSNEFDNAATFYEANSIDLIHDGENINPSYERGGWGYSDHALLTHTSTSLKKIKKPFFSIALSLTNHSPYVIPKDMPKGIIKPDLPLQSHQIVQYVDWSFGEFYKKIKKEHPHTLIILTADEGKRDINFSKPPTYEQIRRVYRVPLLLLSPKIPAYLAGSASDSFGSLVDIAPTLLHLLGMGKTNQQFMGESLFHKKNKIYGYINSEAYLLEKKGKDINIEKISDSYSKILTNLTAFNLLYPPKKEDL